MEFNQAIKSITSRVDKLGIGTKFSYDEINQWLNIKSGEDLMLAYDKLSDKLIKEYSISFELEKDCLVSVPKSDTRINSLK